MTEYCCVVNGSEREPARRRIAFCSAIRIFRDGVARALEDLDVVDLVAVARDAEECRSLVSTLNLEMVLLDMVTPGSVETLRELSQQITVVALAVPDAEAEVIEYAEAGASAYVMREEGLDELAATVQAVARGELPCSARTAGMLLRRVRALAADRVDPVPQDDVHLTQRELDILRLLEEGLSNKQIAARLCIELPTVKNHVHHILEKLGVSRRAEAVAWARRRARVAGPPNLMLGI